MLTFWIILGSLLYLFVGVLFVTAGGLKASRELMTVLCWPVAAAFLAAVGLVQLMENLSEKILDRLDDWFRKEDSDKE